MSSRVMPLMPLNSSLAATSLTGISFRPSLLPPGEYRNRLRKLPGPLAPFMALRSASTSSWLCCGSVRYRMKPACEPLL
ncbi:hypothetical protein DK27_21650 [Xanthomonas arboricola pv. pruni]|nr:hypothetical protein DK27_21650 [Xanthomonas arboricola pv. pruni]